MNWPILLFFASAFVAPKKEFHQGVDYRIEAKLNDSTHVLTGRALLRYTNHSPNTLDTMYFHLYLNAFRPNSAFATRELQFNVRRFQDLGPDDYAYDRIKSITVDGVPVKTFFPNAPDSTVMGVLLKKPIRPEGSVVVRVDWMSRLSATASRRQGRKDRHYDWAHWYPRIAVYDTAGWEPNPLVPQGEFYGEFGTYDVTLDLPEDQIVGATGVPVSGEPGWPVILRERNAYKVGPERSLGLLGTLQKGRKRVRWHAEKVHHFAWSSDPNYVYAAGQLGDVQLHALYLPGDTNWTNKVIPQLKSSLEFYDTVMGPYLYPQLTAAWRIDPGATEFPMFTSHSSPPAIVHETGHEWAHAMLANNEWKQGWLDEGFVSFLQFLYDEANGRKPNYARTVTAIAQMDSAGLSQPLSLKSAEFRDFRTYNTLTYTKPSLVLRMLRYYVGDANMRKGLRLYYEQNKLTHVDEEDFRRAMEQASGMDLREFFQQWFHTVGTIDYAVKNVTSTQQSNGSWLTRVEITRDGDNWMPVDLLVGAAQQRLDRREREFTVDVTTQQKPDKVVLDPDFVLIDVRRANNTWTPSP